MLTRCMHVCWTPPFRVQALLSIAFGSPAFSPLNVTYSTPLSYLGLVDVMHRSGAVRPDGNCLQASPPGMLRSGFHLRRGQEAPLMFC